MPPARPADPDFPSALTDQPASPAYLVSEDAVRRNCRLLQEVHQRTGAEILLALKAFALPALFPVIAEYLQGVCASGPFEARLGREDFGRQVHTYAPAFTTDQMRRVIRYSDHICFNSITQYRAHRDAVLAADRPISMGLRVNPGYSEVEVDLYDPCRPGSRFGVQAEDLAGADLEGIDGLHFHALCEQGADVLVRVLGHFERRFGPLLNRMRWVNFGGGHHITRSGYDLDLLCSTILDFRSRHHGIRVFLEPGEAVVLDAGVFITTVLDIIHNTMDIAILDCSVETHMPDVLAMPYRPHIIGSAKPGEAAHTYRLGGISCLAGDVLGDYSFARPLRPGDRLVLTDMALYSFVKNTTFNGVELPALYVSRKDDVELVRAFTYDDFRRRLA